MDGNPVFFVDPLGAKATDPAKSNEREGTANAESGTDDPKVIKGCLVEAEKVEKDKFLPSAKAEPIEVQQAQVEKLQTMAVEYGGAEASLSKGRLSGSGGVNAPLDWVKKADGTIYWDNQANSEATTRRGEEYLGKNLSLTFNSYIDAELWDGPGGSIPAGDKLTSRIDLISLENELGELTGIETRRNVQIGSTPLGTARDFFPGLGDGQNSMKGISTNDMSGYLSVFHLYFEQHASVSEVEEFGLNELGYDIVNVAQMLNIIYTADENKLLIMAYTDIFPSATLSLNGKTLFKYDQPSFENTHGIIRRPIGYSPPRTVIETYLGPEAAIQYQKYHLRPYPAFYRRYENATK